VHQSLVKKPLSLDKFWQIGEKTNEPERRQFTVEEWKKIKEIHGIK